MGILEHGGTGEDWGIGKVQVGKFKFLVLRAQPQFHQLMLGSKEQNMNIYNSFFFSIRMYSTGFL